MTPFFKSFRPRFYFNMNNEDLDSVIKRIRTNERNNEQETELQLQIRKALMQNAKKMDELEKKYKLK